MVQKGAERGAMGPKKKIFVFLRQDRWAKNIHLVGHLQGHYSWRMSCRKADFFLLINTNDDEIIEILRHLESRG